MEGYDAVRGALSKLADLDLDQEDNDLVAIDADDEDPNGMLQIASSSSVLCEEASWTDLMVRSDWLPHIHRFASTRDFGV